MPLIASALLAALLPVCSDKTTHSVTFTACATDVSIGTTVEFVFVGPDSDRAYEALFVTDADIAEIAKAFDEAGIPRGNPVDPSKCRFWPVGNSVKIEPAISRYLSDKSESTECPIVFTGGLRDDYDMPIASTNMPSALFALYSVDQSLLLFDNAREQGLEYGRYVCASKMNPGERQTFKISWDGSVRMESRHVDILPGRVREAIESLKCGERPIDVTPNFSAELTVEEAKSAATALAVVDSLAVRINGIVSGQMFYRGFLPDELWRDRRKRLTQPLEVRLAETNVLFTIIDEDWSVEGTDPKLTPHEVPLNYILKNFNGDACLFFAKRDEKLSRVYKVIGMLPRSIRNWYVFID